MTRYRLYTTACELRISVHNCWFGEICVSTVACVVLQSPTGRINFVISLLNVKTDVRIAEQECCKVKYMCILHPTLL